MDSWQVGAYEFGNEGNAHKHKEWKSASARSISIVRWHKVERPKRKQTQARIGLPLSEHKRILCCNKAEQNRTEAIHSYHRAQKRQSTIMRLGAAVALLLSAAAVPSAGAFVLPNHRQFDTRGLGNGGAVSRTSKTATQLHSSSPPDNPNLFAELRAEAKSRNLLRKAEKDLIAEQQIQDQHRQSNPQDHDDEGHQQHNHLLLLEDHSRKPTFVPSTYLLEANARMHNYLEDLSETSLPMNNRDQQNAGSYRFMGSQSPHIARGGRTGPLQNGGPGFQSYADSLAHHYVSTSESHGDISVDETHGSETADTTADAKSTAEGASKTKTTRYILELPFSDLPEGAVTTSGGPPLREDRVEEPKVYRYMGPSARSQYTHSELREKWASSDRGPGLTTYLDSLASADSQEARQEAAKEMEIPETVDLSFDATEPVETSASFGIPSFEAERAAAKSLAVAGTAGMEQEADPTAQWPDLVATATATRTNTLERSRPTIQPAQPTHHQQVPQQSGSWQPSAISTPPPPKSNYLYGGQSTGGNSNSAHVTAAGGQIKFIPASSAKTSTNSGSGNAKTNESESARETQAALEEVASNFGIPEVIEQEEQQPEEVLPTSEPAPAPATETSVSMEAEGPKDGANASGSKSQDLGTTKDGAINANGTAGSSGVGDKGNDDGSGGNDEENHCSPFDEQNMQTAIELAIESGDERAAFPKPRASAVFVANDGTVLGKGVTNYEMDCVQAALLDAGVEVAPLTEWNLNWRGASAVRGQLPSATLYTTVEPSLDGKGDMMPPITELIKESGVGRVVIGCRDPIPEAATKGATHLHASGIDVAMGECFEAECADMIGWYADTVTSEFQTVSRKHFRKHKRPLGVLHCSVVDSSNVEAFARNGNAFGRSFGGKELSYRNLGAYEIAPPPEQIWADDVDGIGDLMDGMIQSELMLPKGPVMPWYEQVDACIATFPKAGNGPVDDNSLQARLNGLSWLATFGQDLPPGVERILVMDATDLAELPLTNNDPNLRDGVDVETFWKGEGRKPTRVLLRRGKSAKAQAAANAAAIAAENAAIAAREAREAIETGDAERAAQAAMDCAKAAAEAAEITQKQLMETQGLKRRLQSFGVIVETLDGSKPIDVMEHIGKHNEHRNVVWRAGCWANRGVSAVLTGAFQWASAHLAVDAKGGRFWQLMLAERAVQAACGPESKVKVFSSDDDLSLEYCDTVETDSDCALTVDGRSIRHVRLDCRVSLVGDSKPLILTSKRKQKR